MSSAPKFVAKAGAINVEDPGSRGKCGACQQEVLISQVGFTIFKDTFGVAMFISAHVALLFLLQLKKVE
jgi:hypothetical protein